MGYHFTVAGMRSFWQRYKCLISRVIGVDHLKLSCYHSSVSTATRTHLKLSQSWSLRCIFVISALTQVRRDFPKSHQPFYRTSTGKEYDSESPMAKEISDKMPVTSVYSIVPTGGLALLGAYQQLQWWQSFGLLFGSGILTHWGRDKMDAILQTTFSNAFFNEI